jgi:hypothetical protein
MNYVNLVIALAFLATSSAFSSSGHGLCRRLVPSTAVRATSLHIFGRNKEGDESSGADSGESRKRSVPFFGRLGKQKEESDGGPSTALAEEPADVTFSKVPTPKEPLNAIEQAQLLRAQAERARLEAERMDASLTLSKIDRLEGQLKDAKKKGEAIDELQRQLDSLQAKLRGEAPVLVVATRPKPSTEGTMLQNETTEQKGGDVSRPLRLPLVLGTEEFEDMKRLVQNAPGFVKKVIADMVEVDYDTLDGVNSTEVVCRLTMAQSGDFSYSSLSKPEFTDDEIEGALKQFANSEISVPKDLMASFGDDQRKLAEYVLKSQYYLYARGDQIVKTDIDNADNEEVFKELAALLNTTVLDRLISNNYPECMRKEDSQEVTLSQVQLLASTVLPQAQFRASSKPEKVNGGFIIQGTYAYESGNALLEAIDKELAKAGLNDKMTVLLTDDFVAVSKMMETEEDMEMAMGMGQNESPMLYITGPDVVRAPKPVALSLVSGLGLATSWYFSIYPFLLNPYLAKRVEEQLSVADAGMNYDLEWLTDLSVPLFASFLSLQIIHEVGHRIAAAAANVSSGTTLDSALNDSRQLSTYACFSLHSGQTVSSNSCAFVGHGNNEFRDEFQIAAENQRGHVRCCSIGSSAGVFRIACNPCRWGAALADKRSFDSAGSSS